MVDGGEDQLGEIVGVALDGSAGRSAEFLVVADAAAHHVRGQHGMLPGAVRRLGRLRGDRMLVAGVGAETAELAGLEQPVDPRSATAQTVSSEFRPVRRFLVRSIYSDLLGSVPRAIEPSVVMSHMRQLGVSHRGVTGEDISIPTSWTRHHPLGRKLAITRPFARHQKAAAETSEP
jgi:hypothetical protein